MGQITVDQSHQIMAALATNADWARIDFQGAALQDMILRDPQEAGRQFTIFLQNGGRMMGSRMGKKIFPIWKTIEIGKGVTDRNGYLRILAAASCRVDSSSNVADLLGRLKPTTEKTQIDLAKATTKEITGKDEATRAEVLTEITGPSIGGLLCPPDAGPYLREQYLDQPYGEALTMAMEAIAGSAGDLQGFNVDSVGNDRYLRGSWPPERPVARHPFLGVSTSSQIRALVTWPLGSWQTARTSTISIAISRYDWCGCFFINKTPFGSRGGCFESYALPSTLMLGPMVVVR